MIWLFAVLLTLAVLAVLFLASRRPVVVATEDAPTRAFFRSQLEGIEEDLRIGRIPEAEAAAARAELAREVLRAERESGQAAGSAGSKLPVFLALPLIAVLALGTYLAIGRADLPGQPLAARDLTAEGPQISLEEAVAQVEARLVDTPSDIRGWQVLGPVYMQLGRYSEAANAFRRILELEEPTADSQTDLAEAMIMVDGGTVSAEVLDLLRTAAESDPMHVRSRFYLAGELTRIGENDEAVALWQHLLDIAVGEEPWIATARAGLAAAQAGDTGETLAEPVPDATQDVMIRGMVEGLAARLYDTGGSSAEWMQLVRSRMVLDGEDAAREDLERALASASAQDRAALDAFATDIGL